MSLFAVPAEVQGQYEKLRSLLHPILILIFIFLPWVRVNHEPLFLFDILNRHFILFGSTFYSHDAPLLFFVAILIILSIFIITALYGRLWCGWTCPQSVFLHSVFNQIEKLILGKYTKRIIFYKTESTFKKKIQTVCIYFLFLIVSWILSHSLVAYFLGSDVVTSSVVQGPQKHMTAFTVLSIMTALIFFNFGFFREQFCFIVCPYGRFQNALIDNNSLTVFYDKIRGEPRGKLKTGHQALQGDCINCMMCVRACPAKIDIRDGFQLECIACGKCIDACNEVMTKLHKPKFLIRYQTGDQKKINYKRFRLILYGLLFFVFSVAFLWLLLNRSSVDFSITRTSDLPFSNRIEDNRKVYINQFYLHLKNNSSEATQFRAGLSVANLSAGYKLSSPAVNIVLSPGQDIKLPAFLEIDADRKPVNHQPVEVVLNVKHQVVSGDSAGIESLVKYIKTIEFIKVE